MRAVSSRAAENALLMRSRDLQQVCALVQPVLSLYVCMSVSRQQLARDHAVLEKVEGFPESDSSETIRLRQILLQQKNELMQTEERVEKLNKEINKCVCMIRTDPCTSIIHVAVGLRRSNRNYSGSTIACQRRRSVISYIGRAVPLSASCSPYQ